MGSGYSENSKSEQEQDENSEELAEAQKKAKKNAESGSSIFGLSMSAIIDTLSADAPLLPELPEDFLRDTAEFVGNRTMNELLAGTGTEEIRLFPFPEYPASWAEEEDRVNYIHTEKPELCEGAPRRMLKEQEKHRINGNTTGVSRFRLRDRNSYSGSGDMDLTELMKLLMPQQSTGTENE